MFCVHHTIASLQGHFIENHIGRVHVCLAVTCHLHFGQNDLDLLHATAEKWDGIDTEINLEKKSLPQLLPELRPETFESRVRRSSTELLPLLLGWVVEQWVGAVTWDRKMGGHVAFCL